MRKNILAVVFLAICPLLVAQQVMNNGSVIKLVKAGLSEDLIITTINGAAGNYDISADGIIALKSAGASDKVIAAMVAKVTAAAQPAPPPVPPPPVLVTPPPRAAVSALPAGIDEVGVYYKDRSGVWVALMPEVVNFKTGGFMKSIATDGIVKGDLNGHIRGPHGRTTLTFPVVLAVYVPEGTAISEYQLLRLRTHSDGREFRSVTGGIIHASGGANRDLIEFQADKIAPRLYQLTVQSSAGRGEYGLLPPGAYSSSNMGSNGKIYSISIPE